MITNDVSAVIEMLTGADTPHGRQFSSADRRRLYGYWKNPDGYTNYPRPELTRPPQVKIFGLGFSFMPRAVFEFTLDKDCPLTYVDVDGTEYQSDRHFFNDGPSVPTIVHCLVEPERFLPAGYMHDSMYEHQEVYRRLSGESVFTAMKVNRSFADALLYRSSVAGGLTPEEGWVVKTAVRAAGWYPWYFKGNRDERQVALRIGGPCA